MMMKSNLYSVVIFCLLSFVSCFMLFGCSGAKVAILSSLQQDVANEVTLVLGVHDINSSQVADKDHLISVLVDEKDKINALLILDSIGIPRQIHNTFGDVFKKDSLISSPIEEYGRLIYAYNEEIANLLLNIEGIINAKVLIGLAPSEDMLVQAEAIKPSASVVARYKEGCRIEFYTNKIRSLVSNSVPGLSPERVEVLLIQDRQNSK